jgi:hypothetical protein
MNQPSLVGVGHGFRNLLKQVEPVRKLGSGTLDELIQASPLTHSMTM